jgi:hypothetical protein
MLLGCDIEEPRALLFVGAPKRLVVGWDDWFCVDCPKRLGVCGVWAVWPKRLVEPGFWLCEPSKLERGSPVLACVLASV